MACSSNGQRSCHSSDTFVVLPPASSNQGVIFGKNSHRPECEVQEVIYVPAADHAPDSTLMCTYLEIPQVARTHAVILSKPAWMWGAEMGANEHGVCIGKEAVQTKLLSLQEKKLPGMDLVRLGLERSSTAKEALDVLTSLLSTYGQGGPCVEDPTPGAGTHASFLITDGGQVWILETAGDVLGLERGVCARQARDLITELLSEYGQCGACEESGGMTGHNTFIIADPYEAWVLETVGHHWAAQCLKTGVKHISNELNIRTKIDAMSDNCKEFAQSKGWWNPDDGDFDFAKAYSDGEVEEMGTSCASYHLLEKKAAAGAFGVKDMMSVLRHDTVDNCGKGGSYISTGSQVSILSPPGCTVPSCHWFTATPNPLQSTYKPFVFCTDAGIGDDTTSPKYGDLDPVRQDPMFQSKVDRDHALWKAHGKLRNWLSTGDPRGQMLLTQLRELESHCCEDMQEAVACGDERSMAKVAQIFQHMVSLEINFYK